MNYGFGTTALEERTGKNQRETKEGKVPFKAIARSQAGNKIRRARAVKRKTPAQVRKEASFVKSGCLKRSPFNRVPQQDTPKVDKDPHSLVFPPAATQLKE